MRYAHWSVRPNIDLITPMPLNVSQAHEPLPHIHSHELSNTPAHVDIACEVTTQCDGADFGSVGDTDGLEDTCKSVTGG